MLFYWPVGSEQQNACISDVCLLDNNDARELFCVRFAHTSVIISCNHLTFKSTFKSTVSLFFPPHCTLRNIPNPSFIVYTKLGLQFNFPSVPSLKYDPRNEIRAAEYRVWSTAGRRMETWPDSEVKRHALVGEGRPDPAPQVLWLNICPAPLGCLDTSTQPPPPFPPSHESWRGQLGRVPSSWPKFSPQCQRLQEFNNLERLGFAFLKPLGQHLESRAFSKQSTDWKNKCRQMIFVLPVIWRKYPRNSTSSPCRRLWAGFPYSSPFSLLSNGRNFNCQKTPKTWRLMTGAKALQRVMWEAQRLHTKPDKCSDS